MTLVREQETDPVGGFTVLILQMVTRVKCPGYDAGQQESHIEWRGHRTRASIDVRGSRYR